jgi:DeoR/GlpR family transcriptional regulator of sugar metabolism
MNIDDLNDRQRWFFQQLQSGRAVNTDDIVKRWKIGIATAERDIRGMKKSGLIEFVGAPKTGRYQLKSGKVS